MPKDAHISTHAKLCALEILTMLRTRYNLPELETGDLYTITERIEQAITDACNVTRILDDAGIRRRSSHSTRE